MRCCVLEKCRVVFQPMNKDIEVNKGENLLNAARKAGVNIDSPCGGKGSCGKCRVILEKGELKTENTSDLTPEEKQLLKILAERNNLSISGLILRLAWKEYYNIK